MTSGVLILYAALAVALVSTLLFVYAIGNLLFGAYLRRTLRRLRFLWRTRSRYRKSATTLPHPLTLSRTRHNPIMRQGPYEWEQEAVMNPAAVHAGGKTHLFYRAIGTDGVSRLGYASSRDGITIDERLPYPIYAALDPRGGAPRLRFDPVLYPSGGSWGGAEDPRAVIIDERVYLTFNMFDGWDFMRVALMSLSVQDLLAKRWNWTRPRFLSKEGERHKNWVLFPEKVDGKFAFLHNLHGEDDAQVRIEYVNDFAQFDPAQVASPDPNALPDRPRGWHKRMRSAGPPPVATPYGWLQLYHATDHESHRYKMGALLLDRDHPERILARAPAPILVPDALYENEGKPGIIYACGATVKDGLLRIYYGGGDRVVCTATAHLSTFVRSLLNHRTPQLLTT